MSRFIGSPQPFKISIGADIPTVHNILKTTFTALTWRVVKEDTSGFPCRLWLLPPASEPVGNAYTRNVLLVETNATEIRFKPVIEALQAFPQIIVLAPKTAGSAAGSVTIDGKTVDQPAGTLNPANTKEQNLRYLFEALAASTLPVVSDFVWTWEPAPVQGADDPDSHILGVRKTAAANVTVTVNTNIYLTLTGDYAAAAMQNTATNGGSDGYAVTIDLIQSGTVVYVSGNARALTFATKTSAGFFGPIHAVYSDNDHALALVPKAKHPYFTTPIELMVGIDDIATSTQSRGKVSHCWAMPTQYGRFNPGDVSTTGHPFMRFWLRGRFQDVVSLKPNIEREILIPASGLSEAGQNYAADDFQIHRMNMNKNEIWQFSLMWGNAKYAAGAIGAIKTDDWYKVIGTFVDEALILAADGNVSTTLAQAMEPDTPMVDIKLDRTDHLAAAGYVIVEDERIAYTSKDDATTTIKGCTRGAEGTKQLRHFLGTDVFQGMWFTKINGGAILNGYTKPTV